MAQTSALKEENRRNPPPRANLPEDADLSCDATFLGAMGFSVRRVRATDLGHGGIRLVVPSLEGPVTPHEKVMLTLRSNGEEIRLAGVVRHVSTALLKRYVGIEFELDQRYESSSSKLSGWVYDYSLRALARR